jgi:putative ABC transport system substrate-binding protein
VIQKYFVWPLVTVFLTTFSIAQAQQSGKVPEIGFFDAGTHSSASLRLDAFRHGLRELGYVEGKNIFIEYRFAEENLSRLPELAAALVRMKVDVIVARSTPVIRAAKNATGTIPIVMAAAADAVRSGLVASLARPGGNVTGLTTIQPELAGKRIELLRDIVPKLSRVAFLARGGDTADGLQVTEVRYAGQRFGVQVQVLTLKGAEELEGAFSAMIRERVNALIVQPFFIGALGHGPRIAHLAAKTRLPTVSGLAQFADEGGLISYGPDVLEPTRRAAVFVDKILKGAKPADLPVEQPTKFEFVVNLKTAKQIGLTIPPNVLARADRVIR